MAAELNDPDALRCELRCSTRLAKGRHPLALTVAGTAVVLALQTKLGERCRGAGADVVGPSWLLDRLGS